MKKCKFKWEYIFWGLVVICIVFFIWKYKNKEGFDNKINYLDGVDVIYWINLDRSVERRKQMENMLEDEVFNGIKTERISAYDGKTNTKGVYDKFIFKKKIMKDVEYGCLLSHLETIRKFDESNDKIALILEDDATLEFKQYWNKSITSIMQNAPPDWDIIMLCFITMKDIDLNKKSDYEIAYHKYYSTLSYLINKKGSNKVMKIFEKNKYNITSYVEPADSYLCKITNAYAYKYPMFIYKTQNSSTIHNEDIKMHDKSKKNIINRLFVNFKCTIVVSHYNEYLSYLNNKPFSDYNQKIISKGHKLPNCNQCINVTSLPNVGVCVHTYLYYIVENYDNLPDVTIFLPGSCMDEHKKEKTINTINTVKKTKNSVFYAIKYGDNILNEIYNFQLDNYKNRNSLNVNDDKYHINKIRPFGKWYNSVFPNITISDVNYHGIFAVSKIHIYNRTKESYIELLKQVSKYNNAEINHYFERSFLAIFYPIPKECIFTDIYSTN